MLNKFAAEICPICQKGSFEPFSDGIYNFKHARKIHAVPGQHYAKCMECGTRGYLPNQRTANLDMIKEYQRHLPDYISPSDILAVREKYSLTQKEANILFGGGTQGFSKWERGLAVPAGPTARLMKLALESTDSLKILAKIVNVEIPALQEVNSDRVNKNASANDIKPASVWFKCTHYEQSADFENDNGDFETEFETSDQWTLKNSNEKFQYPN